MQSLTEFIDPERVGLLSLGLERLGLEEAGDLAMILVGSGFSDDVDYAALGLAELRLETAGLDLDLLDERGVDRRAERAIHTIENAQSAKGRVSDVHAVG